jgi:hypothetical protein
MEGHVMAFDWKPVQSEDIPDALLANRRVLKELSRDRLRDDDSLAGDIDAVLRLSLEGAVVEAWPTDVTATFVAGIAETAHALVVASGADIASDALARLQGVSDLLLALAVARARDLPTDAVVWACRYWTATRLIAGIPPRDLQSFVDATVSGLSALTLPEMEVRNAIQAETLAYLAARLPIVSSSPNAATSTAATTPSEPPQTQSDNPNTLRNQLPPAETADVLPSSPSTGRADDEDDGTSHVSAPEGDISADEPRVASSSSPEIRRPIRAWEIQFATEQEVFDDVPSLFEQLIGKYESLPKPSEAFLHKLTDLQRQLLELDSTPASTSRLGSAVESAANVASQLLDAGRINEAYRVCNVFAEIAKVAVARQRRSYQSVFERLLLTACRAVARSRIPEGEAQAPASVSREIEHLLTDLVNIMRKAVGTYFRPRERDFYRAHIDTSQIDRLVNNVVAAYFDQRLQYILERNRPQVKEFVRSNLPLVYRLPLSPDWTKRKVEWRSMLVTGGYSDLVNSLEEMGDLIDPSEVGKVPDAYRDDITAAAARNDYARVTELLKDSANELRNYLFSEAQRLLQYRAPARPQIANYKARQLFERAQRRARSTDTEQLKGALKDMQAAWADDIDNIALQDWVGYLQARTDNLVAAAQTFERVQKRRDRRNFITDWNLAVVKYERKDEDGAYQMLLPLLASAANDGDFIAVVLALALKRNDKKMFLDVLPRTMSLRYHPLAIRLANELGDTARVDSLVAQLVGKWRGTWDFPAVDHRFQSLDDLRKNAVNKAIAEGMVDEAVEWLEQRIKYNRGWVPNYQALSAVHENVTLKLDLAFSALERRLNMIAKRTPAWDESEQDQLRYRRTIDDAAEELLSLSRRLSRKDLGERAYELSRQAGARDELLDSFSDFAPQGKPLADEPSELSTRRIEEPPPPPTDPKLADRVMWVNAAVVKIRNVQTYLERTKEIDELTKIAAEVGPSESADALTIIRNISAILETFSKTSENADDRAARRTLYARVVSHERQLSQLLNQNALSAPLANLITPFRQALQYVVGDLSRLAGVGPDVDVVLENSFISRDVLHSTVVLRVSDRSERPVTDIAVEVVSETPAVLLIGGRKWSIPKLESQRSELLPVAVEMVQGAIQQTDQATFAVSLRASAEGSPDVDLPIKKVSAPFKHFVDAVGSEQLPKHFKELPLNPSDQVFHGRTMLLNQIRNSFSGGSQGERFFFDGIRRVGKTSLLNFLPHYLPEFVFPVMVNFDLLPLRDHFTSAIALEKFASIIAEATMTEIGVQVEVPQRSAFIDDPGRAFMAVLGAFRAAAPKKVPLLMVDEFQELLSAINRSGDGRNRDTTVLDLLRGHLDEGRLFAFFTGSVRFERLAAIAGGEVRIFGSLTELPVSFLSAESVRDVLAAGMTPWGGIPEETAGAVFDWTGGYPWLVQKYGLELVNILNEEHRTIATPRDVEMITQERILPNDSLFKFWWDVDQLHPEEERFVERLLRQQGSDHAVRKQAFFADVTYKDRERFRVAFDNLKACEVLDSRQPEFLRFGGRVLRQWLQQHVEDGQLRVPKIEENVQRRGRGGIFIDHENMFHSLRAISEARGIRVPERDTKERLQWFRAILGSILTFAERQLDRPRSELMKVAVAFWNRPAEAQLSEIYHEFGFSPAFPVQTDKGNEVDFKLADEIRRAREQANREGTVLTHAIIVTGDVDLSHSTLALKNDGVAVQVVAGSKNISDKYILIVGRDNFVALQDVSGL